MTAVAATTAARFPLTVGVTGGIRHQRARGVTVVARAEKEGSVIGGAAPGGVVVRLEA